VAAGLAKRAEIQIAYAIGQARPVGTYVETFGTETVDPARISEAISEIFDLRPRAIIDALDLKRPIYAKTAAHGHFGRDDPDFTWERLDRVDDLKAFYNACGHSGPPVPPHGAWAASKCRCHVFCCSRAPFGWPCYTSLG
jgi:S-adenosylmethionine synthetase